MTTQSDDQRILASQGLNECLGLVIVDLLKDYAFGQLVLAVGSRDCRDSVLASPDQGFSHEPAAVSPGLHVGLLVYDLLAKQGMAWFHSRQRWQHW